MNELLVKRELGVLMRVAPNEGRGVCVVKWLVEILPQVHTFNMIADTPEWNNTIILPFAVTNCHALQDSKCPPLQLCLSRDCPALWSIHI